jgi:hypothetical protein
MCQISATCEVFLWEYWQRQRPPGTKQAKAVNMPQQSQQSFTDQANQVLILHYWIEIFIYEWQCFYFTKNFIQVISFNEYLFKGIYFSLFLVKHTCIYTRAHQTRRSGQLFSLWFHWNCHIHTKWWSFNRPHSKLVLKQTCCITILKACN